MRKTFPVRLTPLSNSIFWLAVVMLPAVCTGPTPDCKKAPLSDINPALLTVNVPALTMVTLFALNTGA